MPFLTWDDKTMSVHVGALDDDHRKLVSMIDAFFCALQDKRDKKAVVGALDKVVSFAIGHFAREEALFEKTGYPDAVRHKSAHAEMTKRVLAYQQKVKNAEVDELIIEDANFVWTWLVDHDLTFDKKYGPFLNSKGIF
jgi:hemerythrin